MSTGGRSTAFGRRTRRLRLLVLLAAAALTWGRSASADESLPAPLAAYAGKIVVLDFWASWCGPCAQSFPWLNQMQARYGKQLSIVGVDVDAQASDGQAFLARHPAQFDVLHDPKGELAERYHIAGMPSTVILDAAGHVIHQHSGFHATQTSDYEAALRQALSLSPIPTGNAP